MTQDITVPYHEAKMLQDRIAELEAEIEKLTADDLRKLNLVIDQREAQRFRISELEAERKATGWTDAVDRIADLEAERDKWKEASAAWEAERNTLKAEITRLTTEVVIRSRPEPDRDEFRS